MYPFECSKCRRHIHAVSATKAECCPGAHFQPLVNICLLVSEKELTGQPIIHKTPEFQLPAPTGVRWGTACGAKTLPKVTTRAPNAVTCKRCLDWYNKRVAEIEAKNLDESLNYSEV